MKFISYAQNFEDVMLFRALGEIKNGFYVDVGAQQPVVDSVTKAFYERGWSGINIEPVEHWYKLLCEDRLRDVNLNVAVSSESGKLLLYSVTDTGLSTAEPEYADRYRKDGREVVEINVPVRTLTDILDEQLPSDIHFLKIDVEGFEQQVITGLDLRRYRPWVLVVESTLPNSTEERYAAWEIEVLSCDYRFVYFDGLNRFYISEEHAELVDSFSIPPNVFDNFELYDEWLFRNRAIELGEHVAEIKVRLEEYHQRWIKSHEQITAVNSALDATRRTLENTRRLLSERDKEIEQRKGEHSEAKSRLASEVERLRNDLEAVVSSTSWRATAPLRGVVARLSELPRRMSELGMFRRSAAVLLKPFPRLKQRLVRFLVGPPTKQGSLADIALREAGDAGREFVTLREKVRAKDTSEVR